MIAVELEGALKLPVWVHTAPREGETITIHEHPGRQFIVTGVEHHLKTPLFVYGRLDAAMGSLDDHWITISVEEVSA